LTKTEDVINLLKENKSNEEIKAETNASDSLISRCRTRYKLMNEGEEEEEVTDKNIDSILKIKIKPEKKYITKETKETKKTDEDYKCMGCNHEWQAKKLPKFCPNCGCEF